MKNKGIFYTCIFLFASLALNQITGYYLGRNPLNIIVLFIIPVFFFRSKNKEISIAAKIAVLPGLFLLFLFYGVGTLLKIFIK